MNGKSSSAVASAYDRPRVVVLLSMLITLMTLAAALYQNYIYTKQLDAIQRNVTRGEYIRACRDAIEAYFQIKLHVGYTLMEHGDGTSSSGGTMHRMEGANVVS